MPALDGICAGPKERRVHDISQTQRPGRSRLDAQGSKGLSGIPATFGPEQPRVAAEDWVDELEFVDILPEPAGRDWRSVTIAAAARLANRLNVDADRRTPRDTPADTIVSPILSSNCPAAIRLA